MGRGGVRKGGGPRRPASLEEQFEHSNTQQHNSTLRTEDHFARNFSLKGSPATPVKLLMILNCPLARVSPMNTLFTK